MAARARRRQSLCESWNGFMMGWRELPEGRMLLQAPEAPGYFSGSRPASSFPPVPGVEVSPGENPAPAAFLRFGAAIDDDWFGGAGNWMRGESLGETFERGEVLARRSLAGLDLHQHEVGSLLQDQVDLQAVAVAIEGKPWPAAAMEMSLGDLGHDPGL